MTDAANAPEAPAPKHRRQAAWRARNPEKRWAHVALASGLRRGLVKREPCQRCGNPESDGHHVDYERPLLVAWLCRRCHKAEHAQERRAAG